MPRDGVFELGVPNRSTPSRAAVMIAEPNVEGSKRPGRFDAPKVVAWDRVPMPEPIMVAAPPLCKTSGLRNVDDCGNFSFLGDARCA